MSEPGEELNPDEGNEYIESVILSTLLYVYFARVLWYYEDRAACLQWKRIKTYDVKSCVVISMIGRMTFQILENAFNGAFHYYRFVESLFVIF